MGEIKYQDESLQDIFYLSKYDQICQDGRSVQDLDLSNDTNKINILDYSIESYQIERYKSTKYGSIFIPKTRCM